MSEINTHLASLRSFFADVEEPSQEHADALKILLEDAPNAHRTLMLEYAASHVAEWPEKLLRWPAQHQHNHAHTLPVWFPIAASLTLSQSSLEPFLTGPVAHNLTHLDVTECALSPDVRNRIFAHPNVRNVSTLRWRSSTSLTAMDLASSRLMFSSLEELDLHLDPLSVDAMRNLASLPLRALHALHLSTPSTLPNNPVYLPDRAQALRTFLQAAPSWFSHVTVCSIPAQSLHPRAMHRLMDITRGFVHLNLSQNELKPSAASLLAYSPKSQSLHTLNLSCTRLGSWGLVRAFAESTHLYNLRSLDLSRNNLSAEDCSLLAASHAFPNLRSLNLSGSPYLGQKLPALLKAPWMPNLRHLSLAYSGMTPEHIERISKAKSLHNLRTLNLCGATLSRRALHQLAVSPTLSNLHTLDLSNARGSFTEEDLDDLEDSPELPNLETFVRPDAPMGGS